MLDKQGNKRTAVEVVVDNVSFVGGKPDRATGEKTESASHQAADDFQEITDDEDLPF